jgi:hypothetical protein
MNYNKLILGIAVCVGLAACETELDSSMLTYKPRLVVNSLMTTDQVVWASVNSNIPLADSLGPAPIENATVVLFDQAGNQYPMPFNFGQGRYEAAIRPNPGEHYEVVANYANFPQAVGNTSLPKKVNLPASTWVDNTGVDEDGFPTGTLSLKIVDEKQERNYYNISLYRYDDFIAEWFIISTDFQDKELEAQSISTPDGGFVISDALFNGAVKTFNFTTPFASKGQQYKYMVKVQSLNEDYFLYVQSLDQYTQQSGLFTEPVSVYSNIEGGLGICAGASVLKDTIR